MAWGGQGVNATRCVWCERAHTCAPAQSACLRWEYRLRIETRTYSSSPDQTTGQQHAHAVATTARKWASHTTDSLLMVTPQTGRTRSACADFYLRTAEYEDSSVYDPARQYHYIATSANRSTSSDGPSSATGWFDFSVAAKAASTGCVARGLGGSHGLFRLTKALRACTRGNAIGQSPTVCEGMTGDVCDFICYRGYQKAGTHTCGADGTFRGCSCAT